MSMKVAESKPTVAAEQSAGAILLKVGGIWRLTESFPNLDEVMPEQMTEDEVRVVPDGLAEWDSSLPMFLLRVRAWCGEHTVRLNLDALPATLKRLFRVILASEGEAPAAQVRKSQPRPFSRRIISEWKNSTRFIGECAIGTIELPTDPRHFHWKAFFMEMVDAGPKALPIIGLLSFLIGITFAFESSIQLARFGLEYYVVQGIGGAVLRQIGPLIAAVLLAGRTGAAFAAHIANMKLNGEIDALEMLGVSPVNFLVLPRIAALILMLPLITLYSDALGLLGGMAIAVLKINVTAIEFLHKLQHAISIMDIEVGVIKSLVFAVIIGLAGTLRGLQSERSSDGVGHAVTAAVVTGIASIIVADALFSPILHRLGL